MKQPSLQRSHCTQTSESLDHLLASAFAVPRLALADQPLCPARHQLQSTVDSKLHIQPAMEWPGRLSLCQWRKRWTSAAPPCTEQAASTLPRIAHHSLNLAAAVNLAPALVPHAVGTRLHSPWVHFHSCARAVQDSPRIDGAVAHNPRQALQAPPKSYCVGIYRTRGAAMQRRCRKKVRQIRIAAFKPNAACSDVLHAKRECNQVMCVCIVTVLKEGSARLLRSLISTACGLGPRLPAAALQHCHTFA